MERVAFLLEENNLRLPCLLNPESLEYHRSAGLVVRRSRGGLATSSQLPDDPLMSTGGGRTELTLDLLFDVNLLEDARQVEDVRRLTRPLWELSENQEGAHGGLPLVRFFWGMAHNFLGVVEHAAERLERFTPTGIPQRSWLRLRLLRVGEPIVEPTPSFRPDERLELLERLEGLEDTDDGEGIHSYIVQGEDSEEQERLDQICYREYNDASLWPVVAAFNNLADPLHLPSNQPLRLPSRALLERLARDGGG
jgi:hypothetical protein